MNWLIHNPIADLQGTDFLQVYGVLAVTIIVVAIAIVRSRDEAGLRVLPPVPATFDPYELSFLRGGKNAVIRTVLYVLRRRGLVAVTIPKVFLKSTRIVAATDGHDGAQLTGLEQAVFRWIDEPTLPSSLFGIDVRGEAVEKLCEPYRSKLESGQLLRTGAAKRSAMMIPFVASIPLLFLSVYRLSIDLAGGRPLALLILTTVVSLVALWVLAGMWAAPRITARGKAWLKRLQLAHGDTRQAQTAGTGPSSHPGQPDMPSVAMVALFDLGILRATPDAAFAALFARSAGGSCDCGSCDG